MPGSSMKLHVIIYTVSGQTLSGSPLRGHASCTDMAETGYVNAATNELFGILVAVHSTPL